MCVIAVATKERPTPRTVEKMWNRNSDGGGVAWRQNGKVHWKKGIQHLDDMQELVLTLPLPFVSHYRIATSGGKGMNMCHPFPISPEASLATEGITEGAVLFHNGTWNDWNRVLMEVVIKHGGPKPPKGRWSDTRAMAWLTDRIGPVFLECMDNQKTVYFAPDELEFFGYWFKFEDLLVSNNFFTDYQPNAQHWNGYTQTRTMCKVSSCTETDINTQGYCKRHDHLSSGGIVHRPNRPAEQTTLPVIEGQKVEVDGNKATALMKVTDMPEIKVPVKTLSSGGNSVELPFAKVHELYLKEQITKTQYKKAQKRYVELLQYRQTQTQHQASLIH